MDAETKEEIIQLIRQMIKEDRAIQVKQQRYDNNQCVNCGSKKMAGPTQWCFDGSPCEFYGG